MREHELQTIWKVPRYLPYVQPRLTDEALSSAEEHIGYILPQKYIDLIKIQNGGYIRFLGLNGLNEQIYGIGPYFPSITQVNWTDYSDYVSFELDGLIPFDGDGHWFLCLDYRKNTVDPQITFISTESNREEIVADNFDQYLNMLHLDIDNKYFIESDRTIDQLVNEMQGILNVKFFGPDDYAQGYPVYQFQSNGNWVWISPNEVPGGFVRQNDERYEELKKEMDGKALRYPEIPSGATLIQFSDEKERISICKTLVDNSYKIISLTDMIRQG